LPKKGNQLNPKLVFALGGVVVAIVAIVVVIFTFSGSKQTGTDATPTPEASPEVTPTPEVVETPATTPTPVATKGAKNTPAPTPTPTLAEAPVPTDTAGLIKYALAQVTTILDRVQKELPDSDPTKAARQKSLGAYKEELARYVSKNIADDSARNYAESALSQIKGLKIQLDALPKPAAGKGKKGK
jgi:type IV secretory pathway VirB10-like protein